MSELDHDHRCVPHYMGVAEVVYVQRVAVPQILEGFPAPQARFPSKAMGWVPPKYRGSLKYPDRRCRFPKTSATPRHGDAIEP